MPQVHHTVDELVVDLQAVLSAGEADSYNPLTKQVRMVIEAESLQIVPHQLPDVDSIVVCCEGVDDDCVLAGVVVCFCVSIRVAYGCSQQVGRSQTADEKIELVAVVQHATFCCSPLFGHSSVQHSCFALCGQSTSHSKR